MADEKKKGSPKFNLNTNDVMEVLKNALLVGVASILTFIVDNIGNIEMGENLLIVIPMVTMALNAAVRWINDNALGAKEDSSDEDTE